MKTVIRKVNIKRFLDAQKGQYEDVKLELKAGKKETHWMWYFFPQIEGLGYSETSKYYALKHGLEEAREYFENKTLRARLITLCKILLKLETNDPKEIFGAIDAMKLQSSMTLFYFATREDIFSNILEKFFNGKKCKKTVAALNKYYDTDFFFDKEIDVILAITTTGVLPCYSGGLLLVAEVKYQLDDNLTKTEYFHVEDDRGYDLERFLKNIDTYDFNNFLYSKLLTKEQYENIKKIINKHEGAINIIKEPVVINEEGLETFHYFKGQNSDYFITSYDVEELGITHLDELLGKYKSLFDRPHPISGEKLKLFNDLKKKYINELNAFRLNSLTKEILDYLNGSSLEER